MLNVFYVTKGYKIKLYCQVVSKRIQQQHNISKHVVAKEEFNNDIYYNNIILNAGIPKILKNQIEAVKMAALDSLSTLSTILDDWEKEKSQARPAELAAILTRMAELVESETESYYKMDPDPFDDRHPGRANPTCSLGHLLKSLFKNEEFLSKLTSEYLVGSRAESELNVVACRLLLDITPLLEISTLLEESENLGKKLFTWAEKASEPLRSYSTGLLAGAMEVQDVATSFKESNAVLVPLLLDRLHELKKQDQEEKVATKSKNVRNFSMFQRADQHPVREVESKESDKQTSDTLSCGPSKTVSIPGPGGDVHIPQKRALSPGASSGNPKRARNESITFGEHSNSSWKELEPYVIGSSCMSPLNLGMQQRLILQYLTPMAEYQELLGTVFEHNAMGLIMYYIDLEQNTDVRLAFDAIRFLANLLCHKKFATEFIAIGGVQKLLQVYRPSVAATGVSLCIYYLSYFEFAMEKVCLLPDHTLTELVSYALWLLECSHRSSRCHACMFFGHALSFRVILDIFDKRDGLRRLLNEISTLDVLNFEAENNQLSEDNLYVSRQCARHVCVALKKYFESHLAQKADELRRSHARSDGGSPASETPAYKAFKLPADLTQYNIELLLECLPQRLQWPPVSMFQELGGIELLIQVMFVGSNWNNYNGKAETIRSALDVLAVCTATPKVQLAMLEFIPIPEDQLAKGISILLGLAEGEIIPDADVQKSALNVIINCVCGPLDRHGGGVGRYMGHGARKKLNARGGEEILRKLWAGVRYQNGIMILLKLLSVKTPITDADSIRTLACKALVGLSRSDTVRQIMSKLPLFTNGQLQLLMKEPVLQDKQHEHVKFCKYASELIERVSGKQQNAHMDASLDDIRRADIVAQTKIIYQEKELLQLIHEHLVSKGFVDTALTLQKEASLPQRSSVSTALYSAMPASPHIYSSCPTTPRMSRQLSHPSSASVTSGHHGNSRVSPTSVPATPPTPSGPIRINLANSRTNQSPITSQIKVQFSSQPSHKTSRFSREKDPVMNCVQSPSHRKFTLKSKGDYTMNLDKLVTEYFRKQHALCRNPVATCPPMSLFIPHRCPTPLHRISAPTNVTSRHFRKHIFPPSGGPDGVRCDRKFVYSRFRNIRSYRDTEDDCIFSCCRFSMQGDSLLLGTYLGDVKLFNLQSGKEELSLNCHSALICHCEQTKDSKLLLTSALWGRPMSALWSMGENFQNKLNFEEDNHVEFSHQVQDRIVGTKEDMAHIYDANTGQLLLTLYEKSNGYTRNAATFSPSDDLVLNDGVLWDVRSGNIVHQFDKFNQNISGTFHPNNMEVIINSEVWDLRTYHLLRTVPALDQCQIKFNNTGDVIYGALYHTDDSDASDERIRSFYGSTFRTFDATDYTNIATIDIKKNILDLCTDKSDCYLAIIESQKSDDTVIGSSDENVCRLYEVGKLKDEEDDEAEEDDETLEHEEDDDNSEDDDDGDDIEVISIGDSDEDNGDDGNDDEAGDQNDDDDSDGQEGDDPDFDEDADVDDDGDLDDDILFELL